MSFKIRYEIDHCRSQVHKVRWQYDKVETGRPVLFWVNVENWDTRPEVDLVERRLRDPNKIGRAYVGWFVLAKYFGKIERWSGVENYSNLF